LVLVSQRGQVLKGAEAVSPAAITLAVAISAVVAFAQLQVSLVARVSAAAIARRRRSTVVVFEQHRPFVAVVHTLPGEILAD
jgi:hypothetical protein